MESLVGAVVDHPDVEVGEEVMEVVVEEEEEEAVVEEVVVNTIEVQGWY